MTSLISLSNAFTYLSFSGKRYLIAAVMGVQFVGFNRYANRSILVLLYLDLVQLLPWKVHL